MRRRILMALLALGAIGGFASGFARLRHAHHGAACHAASGEHAEGRAAEDEAPPR